LEQFVKDVWQRSGRNRVPGGRVTLYRTGRGPAYGWATEA
jgi:hypothetical protein